MSSINVYEFEGNDYNEKKKLDEAALTEAQIENLQKGFVFSRRAGKKEGNYHIEKKVQVVVDSDSEATRAPLL